MEKNADISNAVSNSSYTIGIPDEYRAYFDLFRESRYFECHEALEKLWLRDKNRFYQALIQLAVALYHLSRGNSEGGRKLLAAAEEKLREYPSGALGMDALSVADWIAEMRRALPEDRRDGPPVSVPRRRLTMRGAEPLAEAASSSPDAP
jgi:hypothetical protein